MNDLASATADAAGGDGCYEGGPGTNMVLRKRIRKIRQGMKR
jgi:hypothetical protein